jgi:hypothetical protein
MAVAFLVSADERAVIAEELRGLAGAADAPVLVGTVRAIRVAIADERQRYGDLVIRAIEEVPAKVTVFVTAVGTVRHVVADLLNENHTDTVLAREASAAGNGVFIAAIGAIGEVITHRLGR